MYLTLTGQSVDYVSHTLGFVTSLILKGKIITLLILNGKNVYTTTTPGQSM